jgi:hypothetical protein
LALAALAGSSAWMRPAPRRQEKYLFIRLP